MIKIDQENGIYVIKLPTNALSRLGKDSQKGQDGTIWTPYDIILPVEKEKDYGDSKHITYDKQDHKIVSLGSGLIDQSQKATAAAIQIADK